MKDSLITKLEALADRHQEVSALLGDAETAADQNRFRELSKEFSHLNEVVSHYQQWMRLGDTLADARQMQDEPDAELRELASEEAVEAEQALMEVESALQVLLLQLAGANPSKVWAAPVDEPSRFGGPCESS